MENSGFFARTPSCGSNSARRRATRFPPSRVHFVVVPAREIPWRKPGNQNSRRRGRGHLRVLIRADACMPNPERGYPPVSVSSLGRARRRAVMLNGDRRRGEPRWPRAMVHINPHRSSLDCSGCMQADRPASPTVRESTISGAVPVQRGLARRCRAGRGNSIIRTQARSTHIDLSQSRLALIATVVRVTSDLVVRLPCATARGCLMCHHHRHHLQGMRNLSDLRRFVAQMDASRL